MEERSEFHKNGLVIGGLIGALFGVAIIRYIFAPVILVLWSFCVMNRLVKNKNEYIKRSIAIQVGHVLWFIIGVILYYFMSAVFYSRIFIDIGIMLVGVIWLYFKPGLAAILFLTLYQIIALYNNGESFVNAINAVNLNAAGSIIFPLLAHIVLRITAIVFMFIGYKQIRQGKKKNIASPKDQSEVETKL